MTKHYLVKIKFTDYFFFGQGQEERGPLGNTANYFLHSNYFPQQTGIRGFLRYLMLQINDILFPAGGGIKEEFIEKAVRLIGEDSQLLGAKTGHIQSLSPVFVFQNETPLFFRPNEYVEICKNSFIPVTLRQNKGKGYVFLQNDKKKGTSGTSAYFLDGYNAKTGFANGFSDSKGNFIPASEVFKTHLVSGNRMNKDGTPDDEAFYKQEFLFQPKGYSFGFWMGLDENNPYTDILPENGTRVFSVMGKEQKEVLVHFEQADKIPDFQLSLYNSSPDGTKILLLSDTWVETGFEDHCIFAANQFTTFRYVHSSVRNTKDYAALNAKDIKDKTMTSRSDNLHLLQRGSVLYLKEHNTKFLFDTESKKHKEYRNIGYNYFTQLK